MFPAPTTIASSVPASWTACTSRAIASTVPGSIPYSRPPRSASPESLSRIRWKRAGVPVETGRVASSARALTRQFLARERGGVWGTGRFPKLSRRRGHVREGAKRFVREADQWRGSGRTGRFSQHLRERSPRPRAGGERCSRAGDRDPGEADDGGAGLVERLCDGLAGVVDPHLIGENATGRRGVEALREHAFHDLLTRGLRLRLHLVGVQEDRALLLGDLARNVVARPPLRGCERDVHRHLAGKLGRSSRELDEDADLICRRMGVGAEDVSIRRVEALGPDDDDVFVQPRDELLPLLLEAGEAFGRRAAGALPGGRQPTFEQQRAGRIQVPARLLEGALAIHHPRARLVAEVLDEARRNVAHSASPASVATAAGSRADSA